MIHIITGEQAAQNLEAAFLLDENLKGEVVILKDQLEIGPLQVDEEKNHDGLRNQFWNELNRNEDSNLEERSMIKLLIARAQREEEPICFWLAPNANDVMAYFWLLPYFKPFPEMLNTINIIGLPFLNEKGQLFYPNHFSQIPAKEFLKTKRLLKEVSPSEYEVEGDEWARFQEEQEWIRIYDGGKKLSSKPVTHFDVLLKNSIGNDFQKASKVINETVKKITFAVSVPFLEWQLRALVATEMVISQGDLTKLSKDFDVKLSNADGTNIDSENNLNGDLAS